jgi:thiosulfate/3-mercaptopyruvate sulfurtransferase
MENQVIVSSIWLKEHLSDKDLVILDASQDKSNKDSLYSTIAIKKSRLFDIKNVFSDSDSPFPNSLPDPFDFQREARKLGINNESTIVVYDNKGIYSSPRAWFLFRIMGHSKVYILDGGLPEWLDQGFEIEESHAMEFEEGNFEPKFHPDMLQSMTFIKNNIEKKGALIIDARSSGRFDGSAPEPREGLNSGHIPGSINIPFGEVLKEGKFKDQGQLKKVFDDKGIQDEPLVFSCGSGITACILLAASEISKLENATAIFDGSWTMWASSEGMPIEKGE